MSRKEDVDNKIMNKDKRRYKDYVRKRSMRKVLRGHYIIF